MKEEKIRLRKQIIEHMNSLSERTVYNFIGKQIAVSAYGQKEWVEKLNNWNHFDEQEVNTYPIIEKAWEEGKKNRRSEV